MHQFSPVIVGSFPLILLNIIIWYTFNCFPLFVIFYACCVAGLLYTCPIHCLCTTSKGKWTQKIVPIQMECVQNRSIHCKKSISVLRVGGIQPNGCCCTVSLSSPHIRGGRVWWLFLWQLALAAPTSQYLPLPPSTTLVLSILGLRSFPLMHPHTFLSTGQLSRPTTC